MAENWYALLLYILLCELVDGGDIRYLNHSHQPIIDPLKKPLKILLYNDILFSSLSLTLPK